MEFFAFWGICSFIALGSAMAYLGEEHNQDLSKPLFYGFAFIFGPVVLGFMFRDIEKNLKKIKENTKSTVN